MWIISKRTLRDFWQVHPETEGPLKSWFEIVSDASWRTSSDVMTTLPKARTIGDSRVVFEIMGGNYRLICYVYYPHHQVYVKWIGTHAEYDRIDAETV